MPSRRGFRITHRTTLDLFSKCDGFTRARELQAAGLYPYFLPLSETEGTEVEVGGRRCVMIGSNNYLGLTHHPAVVQAATDAVRRYGTSCSGSRFLNGTLELHEELERRLALFLGKEAAICFSTGYQSNLGAISAICGKDDMILCDREDHASIVDGCRLSHADVRRWRHNDLADLESHLQKGAETGKGMLIVVDGLYSMTGDLANLPEIVKLARRYEARLMVDEAHSIGVLGKHGRGAAEHFGLDHDVDLVMATFSKSFASLGGFLAGPKNVIHFVRHQARSLIFSAAMTPAATAAALASLDVIESGPELRHRCLDVATRVRTGLRKLGFKTGGAHFSPIVPVFVGEQERMFVMWKSLFDCGLFTNPVTQPAVPVGLDLIRTSYMATHTDQHVAQILERFAEAGTRTGLLAQRHEGADAAEAAG